MTFLYGKLPNKNSPLSKRALNRIKRTMGFVGFGVYWEHWDEIDAMLYGSTKEGFYHVFLSKMTAEGGPGTNDSFESTSFYISVSDTPLVCVYDNYFVTNDRIYLEKANALFVKGKGIKYVHELMASGKLDSALPLLENLLTSKKYKDHLKLSFYYGACLAADGQNQKAKEVLFKIIERRPKHYDALYNLGQIFLAEKNFEEALEYLKRAGNIQFGNHIILYSMGLAAEKTHRKEEALEFYRKAVETAPENLPYGVRNATSYLKEAEESLERLS